MKFTYPTAEDAMSAFQETYGKPALQADQLFQDFVVSLEMLEMVPPEVARNLLGVPVLADEAQAPAKAPRKPRVKVPSAPAPIVAASVVAAPVVPASVVAAPVVAPVSFQPTFDF